MKLPTAIALVIMALLVFGASCNMQLPGSIRITGRPQLQIPAGNRTTKLSDVWDVGSALDTAAESDPGLNRVDTASGQPLALDLQKSLMNVSVNDFASENLNLDDINQTIDVSYQVPDIAFAGETFSTNIDPIAVPSGVSIPTVNWQLTEQDISPPQTLPSIPINASGYSAVTFQQGTLNGDVTLTGPTVSSLTFSITSARILTSGGDEIVAAENTPVNPNPGATLDFDLAGVELPVDFQIELTIEMSTSNAGNNFDLDIAFSFSGDTAISAASGIDLSGDPVTVTGTYSIGLGADLDFESATIGDGELDVTSIFTGLSGVSSSVTASLLQGGTYRVGPPRQATPISLNGITLSNEDIEVEYEVTVTGSSVDFTLDAGADEVESTISGGINAFSSVDVASSTFDSVESFSNAIDTSTQELVDSVTFTNPVLEITLDNGLPLPVNVDITSPTISGGTAVTFPAVSGNDFPTGSSTTRDWDIDPNPFTVDMASIDLDVAVELDDGSPGDGTTTLTNVSPGDPYTLSGNVTATFDVEQMVVADANFSDQFPEAGSAGLDFSDMASFLPDQVDFNAIDSVLDVTLGSATNQITLFVEARWTDGDGAPQSMVLVDDGSGGPRTITADGPVDIDLQSIINTRPSELFFDYDVTAATATITVDQGSTADQRLAAILTGDIPMSFSASAVAELTDADGNAVIPAQEGDIFGRDPDAPPDVLARALESVASMQLHVSLENSVGFNGELSIQEDSGFDRTIDLSAGEKTIPLEAEEMTLVKEAPFTPVMRLFFDEGDHVINTDGDLIVSIWLETDADIDQSFDIMGAGR